MADMGSLEKMGRELKCPIWYAALPAPFSSPRFIRALVVNTWICDFH
jgi:hypothetical protein